MLSAAFVLIHVLLASALPHKHSTIQPPVALQVESHSRSHTHSHAKVKAFDGPTVGVEVEYSSISLYAVEFATGDHDVSGKQLADGFTVYETPGVNSLGLHRLAIEMDNFNMDQDAGEYGATSELVVAPFDIGSVADFARSQMALSLWAQAAYFVGQDAIDGYLAADADFATVHGLWEEKSRANIRPLSAVVERFRKMLIGQTDPGSSNGQELNDYIPELAAAARTSTRDGAKRYYVIRCPGYGDTTTQVNLGAPLSVIANANFLPWITTDRHCDFAASPRERLSYIQDAVTAWAAAHVVAVNGANADAESVKSALVLFVWQAVMYEHRDIGATKWKNAFFVLPKVRVSDAVAALRTANSATLAALETELNTNAQAGAQLLAAVTTAFDNMRGVHTILYESRAITAATKIRDCLPILFVNNAVDNAHCADITPPTRPLPVKARATVNDDFGIVLEIRGGPVTTLFAPKSKFRGVGQDLVAQTVQGLAVQTLANGAWTNVGAGLAAVGRLQAKNAPAAQLFSPNARAVEVAHNGPDVDLEGCDWFA